MTDILELHSFELVEGPSGPFIRFVARIADAIQVSCATLYDPPQFGSALCRGSLLLGDDDPLPLTEQDFSVLAYEVSTWVPIEDTY